MTQLRTLLCLILCGILLAGCASSRYQPWCALGGGLVGGGAGWAVDHEALDDDSTEGQAAAGAIGAVIGATAGALLCSQKPPAPPPPPPPPVDRCKGDPDGDGVEGDGIAGCPDKCPNTPSGVEVDSDGCPKVGEVLMILEGINFAFNKYNITPESADILDKAVQALRDAPNVRVSVEGYTDSIGTEQYNLGLSQRRAEAVVNYLVDHGIDLARLEPVGYGESNPVASNDTPEGRYKNRRVELKVIDKM